MVDLAFVEWGHLLESQKRVKMRFGGLGKRGVAGAVGRARVECNARKILKVVGRS